VKDILISELQYCNIADLRIRYANRYLDTTIHLTGGVGNRVIVEKIGR